MPSTFLSLHYHVVFSTKHREPLIALDWRAKLHDYLGGTIRGRGAHPRAVGGVADHVHLLLDLKATHCLADFMRELKKAASAWCREKVPRFAWQDGYAAFTVGPNALDGVRHYIAHQEEHHRTKSFREELVELLEKAGIEYDPNYLD